MAEDPAAAREMVRLSGQRGVPVIVIDGQVVVGFDRPRLEQLLARREERGGLGLAVASAGEYARRHGLELPEGAYVGAVRPGGAGERAGLAVGDVITALGGRPVRSDRDLAALLGALAGQHVRATYWRAGRLRIAELDL